MYFTFLRGRGSSTRRSSSRVAQILASTKPYVFSMLPGHHACISLCPLGPRAASVCFLVLFSRFFFTPVCSKTRFVGFRHPGPNCFFLGPNPSGCVWCPSKASRANPADRRFGSFPRCPVCRQLSASAWRAAFARLKIGGDVHLWRKMKQLGQTAGFGLCFHIPKLFKTDLLTTFFWGVHFSGGPKRLTFYVQVLWASEIYQSAILSEARTSGGWAPRFLSFSCWCDASFEVGCWCDRE